MLRDEILHLKIRQLFGQYPKVSWLDVGAGDGSVSRAISATLNSSDTHYDLVDVSPKNGVVKFDGTGEHLLHLYRDKAPYDFVLFNFVLHHAASNTDGLLQAAAQLSHSIVLQEDMNEEWSEITQTHVSANPVHKLLKMHDPKGVYHSFDGWKAKLSELFPSYKSMYRERHSIEQASDTYGYHVPRALFFIVP
jgi:2-polyprenyl-3-methyl-5-hydroxy-6-metoxy-1,4-benzoquinol methylase